jgi:hypothetical protein
MFSLSISFYRKLRSCPCRWILPLSLWSSNDGILFWSFLSVISPVLGDTNPTTETSRQGEFLECCPGWCRWKGRWGSRTGWRQSQASGQISAEASANLIGSFREDEWAQWCSSLIPGTWEAEMGRITDLGQHRQKVSETLSQQTSWELWWWITIIPAIQKVWVRGSWCEAGPGKNARSYLKNKQSKKSWGHGSSGTATV